MEKIWLKNYEPGVAHEIGELGMQSLLEMFEKNFAEFANMQAIENMGNVLTYAELDAESKALAAFLQNELRIKAGDRVAIMMPNLLQYVVAIVAIIRIGAIVVNVNPLYTVHELEYQLNDSGTKVLLVLENFAHTAAAALRRTDVEHVIVTKISDYCGPLKTYIVDFVVRYVKKLIPQWHIPGHIVYRQAINKGRHQTCSRVAINLEDIAFLQYTGGTTGRSKGAVLTHKNMLSNIRQACLWLDPSLTKGEELIITALPLYHIFSLTANLLTFMNYGALNVLVTNPRDISYFIKTMKKFKFTAITGVNTLFNALLNHNNFKQIDFTNLKVALGGGMAVQQVVANKWQDATQRPLLEAYGLTETSPAACINPMDLKGYNGSIGLPIPSTEISIRDEKGRELGIDTAGELWIKGPQVFKEYWQKPQETAQIFSADGWLKTGDVATINSEGYLYIVDRKKDMILVSGFNVYPNEIEDVIAMLEGVLEVAVIGAPDEVAGEIVKAFIVRKDQSLASDTIINHCRKYLTGYKIPRIIEFREELPKTNVGKILRRALRETNN